MDLRPLHPVRIVQRSRGLGSRPEHNRLRIDALLDRLPIFAPRDNLAQSREHCGSHHSLLRHQLLVGLRSASPAHASEGEAKDHERAARASCPRDRGPCPNAEVPALECHDVASSLAWRMCGGASLQWSLSAWTFGIVGTNYTLRAWKVRTDCDRQPSNATGR